MLSITYLSGTIESLSRYRLILISRLIHLSFSLSNIFIIAFCLFFKKTKPDNSPVPYPIASKNNEFTSFLL